MAKKSRSLMSNTCLFLAVAAVVGVVIYFLETNETLTNQKINRNSYSNSNSNFRPIVSEHVTDSKVKLLVENFVTNNNKDSNSNSNSNNINSISDSVTTTVSNVETVLPNPKQNSNYAYVTLISGIDSSYKYRGFLYNAMIMRKSLLSLGSTADFVALIGYREANTTPFITDMNTLKTHGIIVYELPRFLTNSTRPLSFAEMALLKITPYQFIQYQRIQFFDGDIMPTKNMDCFFQLQYNTFTVGTVSPLNSGWYLAIPNTKTYNYLKLKSIWRLHCDWDTVNGWSEVMPKNMFYRGNRPCTEWQFNGADMDQGLFTHYFVINTGKAMLIDTQLNQIRLFEKGIRYMNDQNDLSNSNNNIISLSQGLSCCNQKIPTTFFTHFTGRSKPWMQDLIHLDPKKPNTDIKIWIKHLNNLNIPINSSNIHELKLGSPLGFWNADFPKLNNPCYSKSFDEVFSVVEDH